MRELLLLEQLNADPYTSQVVLARRVGLAPARVNAYMRAFVERGLMVPELKSRGMVYRLTAEGRLSLAYHQVSYRAELVRLTRAARTRFRDFFRALCDGGVRRVVLYGAGETGEVVLDALAGWSGVQVAAVLDDDPARQGGTLHGVPVLAPAALGGIEADAVVITSVTRADEIRAKLHGAAARGMPVHSIAG